MLLQGALQSLADSLPPSLGADLDGGGAHDGSFGHLPPDAVTAAAAALLSASQQHGQQGASQQQQQQQVRAPPSPPSLTVPCSAAH